jgi:3-oxoacyl-[acyl-carrier-protein] synthase II
MTAALSSHSPIWIHAAAATRAGSDGVLDDAQLWAERRSKKVGVLPLRARMVLEAARRCLVAGDVQSAGADTPLRTQLGVSLGTMYGSTDVAEQSLSAVAADGFAGVTPSWYATGLPNATTAIVAAIHDLQGPNLTTMNHQGGLDAIVFACRMIRTGRAAGMLAGGFDLVSERFAARLTGSSRYHGVPAVHPGAGVVWLSADEPTAASAATPRASIVGWAQGALGDAAFRERAFDALLANASRGLPPASSVADLTLHVVEPARSGEVDYLAASAPLALVERIVEGGRPGRHALIARGFGDACACLLVDVGVDVRVDRRVDVDHSLNANHQESSHG